MKRATRTTTDCGGNSGPAVFTGPKTGSTARAVLALLKRPVVWSTNVLVLQTTSGSVRSEENGSMVRKFFTWTALKNNNQKHTPGFCLEGQLSDRKTVNTGHALLARNCQSLYCFQGLIWFVMGDVRFQPDSSHRPKLDLEVCGVNME